MQAWDEFLILQEIELDSKTVRKWLRSLKVVKFDACNLYLEAKDSFQTAWFEEHIRPKIRTQFVNNNNRKIKVHLSVANATNSKKTKKNHKSSDAKSPSFILNFDNLDPNCTFEQYVTTEKNVLAEKLLLSLSESELGFFNPIYIHGGSGTGKTHLLMAASHTLQQKGLRVLYSRAETFTEHVVSAIRSGEMSAFRETYRKSDVLIIDDIQVLSKKGATQEEFFHTFNTLHLENKQIILSANCAPAELHHIEPRLVSRFEWGVVLHLVSLNRDELALVLQQKAKLLKFSIHHKVIDFLLDHFTSGCKTLIKALEALVLRSHLNHQTSRQPIGHLTVPMTKQILQDLLLEERQHILTPEKILQKIAEVFGIKTEDIKGKIQTRDCVFPRQLAMYTCREKLKMPFTKIGELFGKDHSTVMTSVKLIQKGIETNDKEVVGYYHAIEKKIDG